MDPAAMRHSLPGILPAIHAAPTKQKMFLLLQDAIELLFENIKPLPDVFHVPAARENDLS